MAEGKIYVANLSEIKAIVHKTKDIISLIRERGGLTEAYTGLASVAVVNSVKTANAQINAFGVDRIEPHKAIEYPPIKVYVCENGETILSSANLILASYVDISLIIPPNKCKEIVDLYVKGIRELTRPVELAL